MTATEIYLRYVLIGVVYAVAARWDGRPKEMIPYVLAMLAYAHWLDWNRLRSPVAESIRSHDAWWKACLVFLAMWVSGTVITEAVFDDAWFSGWRGW